jgi:hypothetical protein
MIDESWMKGEPLGRAVEGLRRWGIKPKRERAGQPCEPYALVMYYHPDPWNTPNVRYLVCDGHSFRDGEADRWHDEIYIQTYNEKGVVEITRLGDNELAGCRAQDFWQFKRETVAEQVAAARAALAALGMPVSRAGYQEARVTE